MIQRLLTGLSDRFKSQYLSPLLKLLKLEAAICYLQGIKCAHRMVVLTCLLVCAITLIGAGMVLVPLALLLFAPWEPVTKVIVGVCIGAAYLIVPAVALILLLSEKRWMRLTGAAGLLQKLLD